MNSKTRELIKDVFTWFCLVAIFGAIIVACIGVGSTPTMGYKLLYSLYGVLSVVVIRLLWEVVMGAL